MFEDLIKEICRLSNDHLLTPYNLINNAKLPNYEYVKYYKESNFFVSEMKFNVFEESYIFYYYFDEKNMLQKIFGNVKNKKYLFFSRGKELKKAIELYTESISNEKIS